MTNFFKLVAIITVLAIALMGAQIISNSIETQSLKKEDAEINNIKYGLFSVDEWKKQLEVIIRDEIGEFNLSKSNETELKTQVQGQLNVLIDKVIEQIHKTNEGSLKGKIKQAFFNALVDVKKVKAGIPQYADAMIAEFKKPENEKSMKKVVKKEVAKYFAKSFDPQDRSALDAVLEREGTDDIDVAKQNVSQKIVEKQREIIRLSAFMIGLSVLLFLLLGWKRQRLSPISYFMLVGTLLCLLAVGIATPMIDMVAKISLMNFVLLDHEILFKNQILYFQSKSIMDVFWLMINQPELPMKLVGVLVVTFSVVFPVTKLLSTGLFYFDFRGARKNRIVEFFVMKSGKWSMSDVLVVAIFMAYVGFNGVLSSQLAKLTKLAGETEMLTTNGTSLQPGFYLFLSYVLLSMVFSLLLSRSKAVIP